MMSDKAMREAFEAEFQRDWNDPSGDDMKTIWTKAWTACLRVHIGGTPITFDPLVAPAVSFGREAVEYANRQFSIASEPFDTGEMVLGKALASAARPFRKNPTGSVSQPSACFTTYAQYAVSDELTKAAPAPRGVVRERLWAAAQHDIFINTGAIASMLDAGGLARVDYTEYQHIINNGLQPLIDAGY